MLVLQGQRVTLRPPKLRDFNQWVAVRKESRNFLEKWEPRWTSDELTVRAWRSRLRQAKSERKNGTGIAFLVTSTNGNELLGGITLFNIRRGVSQSAQIGYWMGVRHAGKGYMADALRLVVDFSFDRLLLHRIEAACIPGNTRSIRLLEKAGFQREGLLNSYLRINGEWQDHYLYALVQENFHGGFTGANVE